MLKILKYVLFFALVVVIFAWAAIKFYGDAPPLIQESKATRTKGIPFDSIQFEQGKIQAVTLEKFVLNTNKTGEITIVVESIVGEEYAHQKFEIKFAGLMLKGIIGDQSFGIITHLKDSTRYQYDLKKNEYKKKTFAQIRKENSEKKDSTSKEKKTFDILGNTGKKSKGKSKTLRTADLINGMSAIKITNISTNENGTQSKVIQWYAPDVIAKQKTELNKQKMTKILGKSAQIDEIFQQIQHLILKNTDNDIAPNHTLIKLSIENDDKDLELKTEYTLEKNYFSNLKLSDFNVPKKCKIKN